MKILMVQRFDLLTVSCARRILAMAQELARRGHEVSLVQFPHAGRRQELPILLSSLPEGIQYLDLDRSGSSLRSNCRSIGQAAEEVDLVHLWKCYPDAAIPALHAALRQDKPLHYDWDDYEAGVAYQMTESRLVARTVRAWERWVPRLADTLSVASEALKEKALACGVEPDRIWDAPVGADLERFRPPAQPPEGGPHLIYIGQLEVASFAELAVEAFARIAEEFPQSRLTIAGGGRFLEPLREKVEKSGLVKRINLTGYIDADSIPDLLAHSSLALAPFEDNDITRCKSPLKIVEYLAAGLPVIGSNVGEVPRMLEGCGVCVQPGNAEAMAEAVRQVLNSDTNLNEMRMLARKRAEDIYNWGRTVDHLEQAYQEAIGLHSKH